MQQWKTMGYSALLLLLFCLSSTNGFLETNRKLIRERDTDIRKNDQFNDRNFFGSTWQRSYGISDVRRENNLRLFPNENSRQLNERIEAVRDDSRRFADILRFSQDQRRVLGVRENDRKSRLDNLDDRRDRSRIVDRDIRRESRELSRYQADRIRHSDSHRRLSTSRNNERESRQLTNREANERQLNRPLERSEDRVDRDLRQLTRKQPSRERNDDRRVHQLDDRRVHQLDDRRREIRSLSSDREVREINRESRQLTRQVHENNPVENKRSSRQLDPDRRREVRSIYARESRQLRQVHVNERFSRQPTTDRRREIRSLSDNQLREIDRASHQLTRKVQSVDNARRVDERLSRQLDDRRRETQSLTRDRQIRVRESRQLTDNTRRETETLSQQFNNDKRREVRSASRNTIGEANRQSRQLIREVRTDDNTRRQNEISSRQIDTNRRRKVRSLSTDRQARESDRQTRRLDRQVQLTDNTRREYDNLSHQTDNNRKHETRSDSRQIRNINPQDRQLMRRVRSTDITRRENDISSRQLENDRRSRRTLENTGGATERLSRQLNNERRETRSVSLDRSRDVRYSRQLSARVLDNFGRQMSKRLNDRTSRQLNADVSTSDPKTREARQQLDRDFDEIRILDRHLAREQDRRVIVEPHRILTLSSKDENNNRRYITRAVRQSAPTERRMATSFADVSYVPEVKSSALYNAAQLVLLSFLVAQVISNSSKAKKTWFSELNNFVTVTKEKVL